MCDSKVKTGYVNLVIFKQLDIETQIVSKDKFNF